MAVAIVATLLRPHVDNWALIALGVVVGTAIGVPAARRVQMTQMPQMVALFNGVGGGAVALIAWVEFRSSGGYADDPTYVAIFSAFAAIVGSISFWGSDVAFAKLQELIPGKPITLGRLQTPLNALLGLVAVGCGGGDRRRRPRASRLMLVAARQRRRARQPARAADRRRRHAGRHLAAQRVHRALRRGDRRRARQQRDDRRGHARRRLGHAAHAADGRRDEPLRPRDRRGRLRRRRRAARRGAGATAAACARPARPTSRSSSPTPSRS